MEDNHSIYLHIPFCQKRCSYCDFNTFSGMNHLITGYVDRLAKEIDYYGRLFSRELPVKSVFFGGGTPSILSVGHFQQLMASLDQNFQISQNAEISLEANPGTVSINSLIDLRKMGFNRISFGLQTSDPGFLHLLGRIHDHFQSIQAISWAKKAGFANINLDLIYGLPGQSLFDWKKTLEDALNLKTQHISLYALGIEERTTLYDWVQKGIVEQPDPDLAADMYEFADKILIENDFECYEISNYFHNDNSFDFRCAHNLQYWRNQPYLGLGAGAHGFFNNKRFENVKGIEDYIQLMDSKKPSDMIENPVINSMTEINKITEMQETMMVGLRLVNEGVSIIQFTKRFNISPLVAFKTEIENLLKIGLLEIIDNDIIRLTKNGRLLGNQVFVHFVN